MTTVIHKLVQAVTGHAASGALRAVAAVGAVGSVIGAIAWIFGPGRDWHITLNALELSGAVAIGSVVVWWALRLPPPGG